MATASPPLISSLNSTSTSFRTRTSLPTCSFSPKLLRPLASFSVKASRKQVEIVFDPDERLNKIGDDVDKEAPLSRLKLFSPCKINVFLRITGKREDGFHDLASLFHVISLGDTIKFSLSPSKSKDRLSTNVSGVPVDARNLIIKALNLYRKKTGSNKFFWVTCAEDAWSCFQIYKHFSYFLSYTSACSFTNAQPNTLTNLNDKEEIHEES